MSETGQPVPEPGGEPVAPASAATGLADGDWHRLHPATPLLRGGLALLAIVGVLIANLRERLVEWFLPEIVCPPGVCEGPDPIGELIARGQLVFVLGGAALVLLVVVGGFYLAWRMSTFRITEEVVETRQGILFRSHRQARLDRIQDVNIVRPAFARLFGAAKLEIGVAGQGANVPLAYLSSGNADVLRAEILRRAAGAARAHGLPAQAGAGGNAIDRRIQELLAPELDPSLAPPESVVRLSAGRLIGSTVLSPGTVFAVLAIAGIIVASLFESAALFGFFGVIPGLIGLGSYYVSRIFRSLRYSIAGTPDGVRIGYGLLSTRNETLPPGRIHSIAVGQNLLWRPADWWAVRVNRASRQSGTDSTGAQQNSVVLPVGTRADVAAVLRLLLPDVPQEQLADLLERGLRGRGGDGFTASPRRSAVFHWFAWRRNGYAMLPGLIAFRTGWLWRVLILVPLARVQSVGVDQGPLARAFGLGNVQLHTVAGPITARLTAIDAPDAERFFRDAADAAIEAAAADRSHRWRSGEAPA